MSTPLYIHNFGAWPQVRDVFRRAKQQDASLARVQLQPIEAVPGCGKLLALGSHPDFVAEYALIGQGFEKKPDAERLALVILRWYCGLEDDSRIITYDKWLGRVLGRGVKEVAGE
jgi:hypothetical protein